MARQAVHHGANGLHAICSSQSHGANPFYLGVIIFSCSHLSKMPLIMKSGHLKQSYNFYWSQLQKIRDLAWFRQTPSQEPRLAHVNLYRTPLTPSATSTSWLPQSILTLPTILLCSPSGGNSRRHNPFRREQVCSQRVASTRT